MVKPLPKRLIEVDLPIKRISAHARREKSIRHGHISTLHIWWARRPLAACRAVTCAALWPDPADENCPAEFRAVAAELMYKWAQENSARGSEESAPTWRTIRQHSSAPALCMNPIAVRQALLDFIADFANWENSTVTEYLDTARALTSAAHWALNLPPSNEHRDASWAGQERWQEEVPRFLHESAANPRPIVVDPFAGGGSIPLEALRIGADTFASDLNPVPVLLNKVILEYIPKYGDRLAEEVRKEGERIKQEAESELSKYYPRDTDGARPIAYLWARTVQCEGPNCGAEVPLIRSLWLAKKANRCVALQLTPNREAKRVDFRIIVKRQDGWVYQDEPKQSVEQPRFDGTVKRGSATCPCCGYTTPVVRVREQLKARRGGANDARLLCVVSLREGEAGRHYRLPDDRDLAVVRTAQEELERLKHQSFGGLPVIPNEPTPLGGGSGAGRAFSQRNYGMNTFADLFTARQLVALTTFSRLISRIADEKGEEFRRAVQAALSLNFNRVADLCNSLCGWKLDVQCPTHLFARQAISMVWDFAESVPLSESSGSWHVMTERFADILAGIGSNWMPASPHQASATANPLADDTAAALVTDPPYYDAVPYSDLSDFFFVWLRRNITGFCEDLTVTPKDEECIVDDAKGKDAKFFEDAMRQAMSESRRVVAPSGVGVVVFAHKSTAGWEALLQAMIDAGWIVTGSWPIDTEMDTRLRARDSAALASSVHLVCRPREDSHGSDEIGDWRDVLQELPVRIHQWMPRLAIEGVVGADAIFACLGPALEVFSRYSRVEKASGEQVTLHEYLEHIWAAVSKEALSSLITGTDLSTLEADARVTAMWLWTLNSGDPDKEGEDDTGSEDADGDEGGAKASSGGGFSLEYDAARKIAQGLGASLEDMETLVEVKGDQARLLSVAERTPFLFGKAQASAPSLTGRGKTKRAAQLDLFTELTATDAAESEPIWEEKTLNRPGATALDRVHQSMILFAAGRGEALKRFLVDEGIGQEGNFWKLAQALSALYPASSQEKRWVDGVLARKKGLGL